MSCGNATGCGGCTGAEASASRIKELTEALKFATDQLAACQAAADLGLETIGEVLYERSSSQAEPLSDS